MITVIKRLAHTSPKAKVNGKKTLIVTVFEKKYIIIGLTAAIDEKTTRIKNTYLITSIIM